MVRQSKSRVASHSFEARRVAVAFAENARCDNIDFPNERSERQFRTYPAFRSALP